MNSAIFLVMFAVYILAFTAVVSLILRWQRKKAKR